jgi:hypothetical protein
MVVRTRQTWALLTVTWVSVAAVIAVACEAPVVGSARADGGSLRSDATAADPTGPDGESRGPPSDASMPPPDPSRALWSFNAYCGDGTDAGCPVYDDCTPVAGGVGATDCATPFARCLNKSGIPGLADRIFACEPLANAVWHPNRLCAYEDCTAIEAGACTAFEGGIAGQPCTTPLERCIFIPKVFVCMPPGVRSYMFDGYCDAGQGTPACDETFQPCAAADGGIPGSQCTTVMGHCLSGEKIFVCAQR